MPSEKIRILIVCKTYPSPSAKYVETSCIAAMKEDGALIRLYPVPFRLIGDKRQFKKWQWITARVEKAKDDNRPESYRLLVDTIVCDSEPLSTANGWQARREWLDKTPTFEDFGQLERARQDRNITLGLLRPSRILGLDIKPTETPDWTDDERAKLIQSQQQTNLFDDTDVRSIAVLKKMPFKFHYRYECDNSVEANRYRHKIVDWEIGALYWNVRRDHGEQWQSPFRAKLEEQLPATDLMFLMGTIHRFPDQWLIVSLIYPPKRPPEQLQQGSLPLP